MIKMTQDLKDQTFALVPLQDFSKHWTDADLYLKYGLTDEEIVSHRAWYTVTLPLNAEKKNPKEDVPILTHPRFN